MKLDSVLYDLGKSIIDSELEYKENLLLPSGKSGISLFLFYCGRYLKNDEFIEYSHSFFEDSFFALESFGEKISGKTFYGGYTGILWLYQHYINVGFAEYDDNAKSVFDVFDNLIEKEFLIEKETKNYDLLYGLLGYGVYFLERNKFTSQKDRLNDIVNILNDIAIKKEYGTAWEDRFERSENKNKELINLGFAHGIPSILVFLSYVYKETGSQKALHLISNCVDFLRHHELDFSKGSSFSCNILDGVPVKYPSRLAWCYGDLGIGYALLKSGVLLSNNSYIDYGKEILNNLTTKTIDNETVEINDAGFCHGASGVSHLFYKAYKYTHEENFNRSSDYWINNSLKMRNTNGGYSRYNFLNDTGKWVYEPDSGLLEGSAGVGLSLLSRIDPSAKDWDLCFLL